MRPLGLIEKTLLRAGPGVAAYGMYDLAGRINPSLEGMRRVTGQAISDVYEATGLDRNYPTMVEEGYRNASFIPEDSAVKGLTDMARKKDITKEFAKNLITKIRKHKGGIIVDPDLMFPGTMGHEAGHAIASTKPIMGPIQDISMNNKTNQFLSWLPLAGMLVPRFRTPKGMLTMAGLSTIPAIPRLTSEYYATAKAKDALDKLNLGDEQRGKNKKFLNNSYLTYILGLLGPAAGLAGGAGYAKLRGIPRF